MQADLNSDEQKLKACGRLLETDPAAAAAELREFLKTNPLSADGYRMLANADRSADAAQGSSGIVQSSVVSGAQMRLQQAARALQADDLEPAEIILRQRLRQAPGDVEALRLMADLAARLDYQKEAEELLGMALELAPDHGIAALDLARLLYRQNRAEAALVLLDRELVRGPANLDVHNLRAAALSRAGHTEQAAQAYQTSLEAAPRQAQIWSNYGQVLRTLGRHDESISALRRAIEISPRSGELRWGLADLKTHRFDRADVDAMQSILGSDDASEEDRIYLHFALGKAFEDLGEYQPSFANYAEGNALQKARLMYDPAEVSDYVAAVAQSLSAPESSGPSQRKPGPIFVLGMPRSGSTLVEQILGSHPEIEATMELPDLIDLADGLAPDLRRLPHRLAQLQQPELQALGRDYLARTQRYRRTAKPWFVDKMPNNWLYIPLIDRILPGSKIVDVRRHPLDCCLSNFKQLFLNGQGFSNDLAWLGQYYSDYVALLRQVDEGLPGRTHRVIYEHLIDDPEKEVRRLLDHIGVAFDPACLRFHEGQRVVRTASADQVRQPINRRGIESWRPFEPWLGPLKDALGPVLDCYPDTPAA